MRATAPLLRLSLTHRPPPQREVRTWRRIGEVASALVAAEQEVAEGLELGPEGAGEAKEGGCGEGEGKEKEEGKGGGEGTGTGASEHKDVEDAGEGGAAALPPAVNMAVVVRRRRPFA